MFEYEWLLFRWTIDIANRLFNLPLANIGNMPSNIWRKQSFSFGFDLLQVINHSAAKIIYF